MCFSVLMSVYGEEKPEFLEACLQSLCQQTLKADEVVLVEDGPLPLEIRSVIERFRVLLRIVSVRLVQNVGLACALNEGLKFCRNELVARMDTDDIACVDRFEKQVNFARQNPHIAASSGYIEEFDDAGHLFTRVLPLEHQELVKFAKRRSPLSHPAVMFRKQAVVEVGGYPEFRNAQDYALWSLLIVRGYRLANIPSVLVRMRTGSEMIHRRGVKALMHEIKLLRFLRTIGFLSVKGLIFNLIIRASIRLAPVFIRRWLYKTVR